MSIDAPERGRAALGDMLQAIERCRLVLGDLTAEALADDFVRYCAAERLVEIISEASRRLPRSWKAGFPNVPWADIAAIGNVLRHNYSNVERHVMHDLNGEPLLALEQVLRKIAWEFGGVALPGPAEPSTRHQIADHRARLKSIVAARSFRLGQLFRLVSGVESNVYFNMKPTMLDAEGGALLARLMVERLAPENVDLVGGLEMGAVPIVSAVAVESFSHGRRTQAFFVRKKAKEHGAKLRIEGLAEGETLEGKRIAVLEDVCTTGGSALSAIEEIRAAGGDVVLVLAIVDREEGAGRLFTEHGIPFDAVFRAHEFIPEGFDRLPPVER